MQKKTIKKQPKKVSPISLSFKYGAIFLLFTLSIVIVACGSNISNSTITSTGATATTGTPRATPTINFSKLNQLSPTPTLPAQWCGIWVTNESPVFSNGGTIPIYAKFVSQQGGNPVGIAGATVNITIQWGDLSYAPPLQPVYTTSDGLATTYAIMSGHSFATNKLSLITATFTSGSVSCSVGTDRPASFTLVAGSTTRTRTASDTIPTQPPLHTGGNTNNPPSTQSLTSNKQNP